MNRVTVIVVKNEDIVVSAGGGNSESACLIGTNLACVWLPGLSWYAACVGAWTGVGCCMMSA